MFKKENGSDRWEMLMNGIYMKILKRLKGLEASASAKETIRKHWHSTAVFTGNWYLNRGGKMPESELLQGELSARVSKVGCYLVRSAIRVYQIHEPGYCPELEIPADQKDVEVLRQHISEWGDFDACLENAFYYSPRDYVLDCYREIKNN